MDYKKMWQELRGYVREKHLENLMTMVRSVGDVPVLRERMQVIIEILEKMQSIEKEAKNET